MSKKIFKKQEIDKLSKNKYIKSISSKSITYTDEFREYFIIEYLEHHKLPLEIFENVGLDSDIIGHRRIESAANRWKTKYLKDGILSLKDTRSINSGRTKANPTIEDIISKKDAEIAYWKAEAELIKKLDTRERSVKNGIIAPNKVYFLIDEIIEKYNFKNMVKHLCEIAGVSRSGYYKHHKVTSKKELREQHDLKLKQLVLKAKKLKGFDKGSRTITMIINNEFNVKINRKTVQRIMRKYGIKCKIRKTNPYRKMVKATKEHRVLPNVLNREFKQEIPGKVLLTDITYIKYKGSNIAYLSTIKDGSTNEILAYKLSKNLKLDFVLCTVKNLVKAHKGILTKESTIHSDQGVHYTSPKFQKLLKRYGLQQSMSRRGNYWDNAPQKSFFGHMKDEVDFSKCETYLEVELSIKEYIDYYNNYRYQWNLKKLTPTQYRNQLLI